MYVELNGGMVYPCVPSISGGEVLESYITKTRDKKTALHFMREALKRHGLLDKITTDGLRSYGAALDELGCRERQEVGRWTNNRVGNSPLPSDNESGNAEA
jgi:putative transposase